MTPLRRAAALAAPVVLVFSLTACGGGGDSGGDNGGDGGGGSAADTAEAPTDASVEDFCGVFEDFIADAQDVDEDDTDAQVQALQDLGEQFTEVGTPEDMPEDARQGFEIIVSTFGEIDASDVEDEASDPFEFTGAEEDATMAFQQYAAENCDITGQ